MLPSGAGVIVLQGEAAELRTMQARDAAALTALLAEPEIQRQALLRRGGTLSPAAVRELAQRMLQPEAESGLHLGIYAPGGRELIGMASLQRWSRAERLARLGYLVHPAQRGRGIATEAVRLLLRFAFAELGLAAVEGRCRGDNPASERVMRNNGMTLKHIIAEAGPSGDVIKVFASVTQLK